LALHSIVHSTLITVIVIKVCYKVYDCN